MTFSKGEQWFRLLHGYAPVMENKGMTAEQLGRLGARTGIEPLRFDHPGYESLLSGLKADPPRNVILTGTAGDGKTTLCFDLYRELCGKDPARNGDLQTLTFDGPTGKRGLTFIFDMSGWREKRGSYLMPEQVAVLAKFADSVFGDGDDLYVVAVNDGQLHEVFSYLPPNPPPILARLRDEVSRLHANDIEDSADRLRLINLSKISSKLLMERCLKAVLDRPEWICFDEESDKPLFSQRSSLFRNYKLLCTENVQSRLITLAQLADAAGYHLPIRGILCLLVNALLGNPHAKDKILRPDASVARIIEQPHHQAGLHRTLFGEHLSPITRNKREVFRFLSMLQIGEETTNDIDELLIFGLAGDDELQKRHDEIVGTDLYQQRSPDLPVLARNYVRGDLSSDDTSKLLRELAGERRRLFLTLCEQDIDKLDLWRSSVFHHAGDYIRKLLRPLQEGKPVPYILMQRLVAGLNRAWTGQLISSQPDELYLCTGLDVTTATVSDVLCAQIEISGTGNSRIELDMASDAKRPVMTIILGERKFPLPLTLARFEFLYRVADGAMPTSFSRESFEDFAMLKQRCIAALRPPSNSNLINGVRITQSGKIERAPIHLPQAQSA